MIVLDVNVLVAAHMAAHAHHEVAQRFLKQALTDELVLVPDAVWSGFLRIVTNPRIFAEPASLERATEFVEAVVAAPRYRDAPGLPNGLGPFLEMLQSASATAALVPDAYIAAFARVHGCSVATFDRDFRRFDGVRLIELA